MRVVASWCALALALAGCAAGRTTLVASPLLGRPAEVAAPDLAGKEVRVGGPEGEVRVIDFWASWCDPCRDQLPALAALGRSLGARGLRVYAVSVDEDRAQLEAFLAQVPAGLTVLWDRGGDRNTERLDIQRLPTTFLMDRHGVVRAVHQGYEAGHDEALEREVRRLLAEGDP